MERLGSLAHTRAQTASRSIWEGQWRWLGAVSLLCVKKHGMAAVTVWNGFVPLCYTKHFPGKGRWNERHQRQTKLAPMLRFELEHARAKGSMGVEEEGDGASPQVLTTLNPADYDGRMRPSPSADRMRRMQGSDGVRWGAALQPTNQRGLMNDDPAERIPAHRLPNKAERNAVRAYDDNRRELTNIAKTFRTNERDMPKRPPKTKVRTKGGTAKLTIDPEILRAYFERTKSDANRTARYSPPIVNRRLQK